MEKPIIKRKSGVSNKEMASYCETLRDIMLQKKDSVVGRGKDKEVVQIYKYPNRKDVIDIILNSCEFYNKL